MNRRIKGICFDMDGVLIDAREWHYEALNKALAHFGYNISKIAHLTTYDGLPTREKLKIMSKTGSLPVRLHGLINLLKQKYTEQLCYLNCKPSFNHQFALAGLKKNYKLAVCSNSKKNTINTMLRLANINDYFDHRLSCEDVDKPKPDPSIYQKAMKLLKINPSECLILEDNKHGIQAAEASKGYVMKISAPEDVTLDSIADAINLIERK